MLSVVLEFVERSMRRDTTTRTVAKGVHPNRGDTNEEKSRQALGVLCRLF